MCVVSMVTDHYRDRWQQPNQYPWIYPRKDTNPEPAPFVFPAPPSRKDYEDLKRQVEELRELLLKSKKYDEDNGEPDCEMDEKVAFVKAVAKSVGVSLDDVFGEDDK